MLVALRRNVVEGFTAMRADGSVAGSSSIPKAPSRRQGNLARAMAALFGRIVYANRLALAAAYAGPDASSALARSLRIEKRVEHFLRLRPREAFRPVADGAQRDRRLLVDLPPSLGAGQVDLQGHGGVGVHAQDRRRVDPGAVRGVVPDLLVDLGITRHGRSRRALGRRYALV